LLNKLRDKLKELEGYKDRVFYGIAKASEDKNFIWNYIVFGRVERDFSETKLSMTDVYEVVIVMEDYIPEGLINDVISKVEECGLRLKDDPAEYSYTNKNGSDITVELLSIQFTKALKRCC